ncbi:MAG TPA: formyltransferase family protein [Acidimicrobiales bacterium]|nr:formyltransferase family protein [Acidimicrobiales bacterium]
MTVHTDGGARPDGPETRVLFCGDRQVSARLVELMRAGGATIVALGLNSPPSPHSRAIAAAAGVDPGHTFYGRSLASTVAVRKLEAAAPDLGVCCGFGPILPRRLLTLPRWGWVNVHRSYLPYNRGLDPLQWAVIEGTPAGVSVHVMTDEVDAGDVIEQAEMPVLPTDDGDALEARADALAFEVFERCWPRLQGGDLTGTAQDADLATYHSLADCEAVRRLDPNATMRVGRLLDVLRCYSGANYSAVHFGVGLLRTRFTVHTEVRMSGAPTDGGNPPTAVTDSPVRKSSAQEHPPSPNAVAVNGDSSFDSGGRTLNRKGDT